MGYKIDSLAQIMGSACAQQLTYRSRSVRIKRCTGSHPFKAHRLVLRRHSDSVELSWSRGGCHPYLMLRNKIKNIGRVFANNKIMMTDGKSHEKPCYTYGTKEHSLHKNRDSWFYHAWKDGCWCLHSKIFFAKPFLLLATHKRFVRCEVDVLCLKESVLFRV